MSTRAVVGLVVISAFVGLFTLVDSESPLRAAVAMGLVLPLLGACLFLAGRGTRIAGASALGVLGVAVALVPLVVSGRYPRIGGGGGAPAGVELIAVGALIFLGFSVIGWVVGGRAHH